jgi:hypothetical protein
VVGGWNKESKGSARKRKSLGLRKGREGAEKTITLLADEDRMRKGDDNGNQDTEIRIDFGTTQKASADSADLFFLLKRFSCLRRQWTMR